MTISKNLKAEIRRVLPELIHLRKQLHKHAELSGQEEKTSQILINYILQNSTANIIQNLGGYGFLAVFDSNKNGPTICLRAELDALPIAEENQFDHCSLSQGISHKCGHDGHMTVLAGISNLLAKYPTDAGRIVLVFQPEEEVGKGAVKILNDPRFQELKADYILALHNFPGFPLNQILVKSGTFFCASRGMIVKLTGKISHAAYPEQGINPALAMSQIISELDALSNSPYFSKSNSLITIVHSRLGESGFGTSPGDAIIMCTLRSETDETLELLADKAISYVKNISFKHNLNVQISWMDSFEATQNNPEVNKLIIESAGDLDLEINILDKPFRPAEDFGIFTKHIKGSIFGIGAGRNHPGLHNADYDFPEKLIEIGVQVFWQLIHKLIVANE